MPSSAVFKRISVDVTWHVSRWINRKFYRPWISKKQRIAGRLRAAACYIEIHTERVDIHRYRHLKVQICTCTHCGAYIEKGYRIETEVPYNIEMPFEHFKVEHVPSADPASAFYKPPELEVSPVVVLVPNTLLKGNTAA
jgi:hypothetical protein